MFLHKWNLKEQVSGFSRGDIPEVDVIVFKLAQHFILHTKYEVVNSV